MALQSTDARQGRAERRGLAATRLNSLGADAYSQQLENPVAFEHQYAPTRFLTCEAERQKAARRPLPLSGPQIRPRTPHT